MGNISPKSKKERKVSLSTLNVDCLFHIFSYLELPDLLNLRTQCSTLNYVVSKYLPRLTTLSVVLSEPKRSKKDEPKWLVDLNYSMTMKHFEQEQFVTIREQRKHKKFIEFINKYEIRNVQKLTLIMSNNSHFKQLSELLELFPRVRILFLDKISCNFLLNPLFRSEELDAFFDSISNLSSLNELHFFPIKGFDLHNHFSSSQSLERTIAKEKFKTFESAMRQKLRFYETNNLRNMAVDLSTEIVGQTTQIWMGSYDCYGGDNKDRLKAANERANKLLY